LAPDLVIEIVSPNDRADDLLLKVSQYIAAGTQAVWIFYPNTGQAYRYSVDKLEPEVRSARLGHAFEEPELLPGLCAPLAEVFGDLEGGQPYSRGTHNGCALRSPDRSTHIDPPDYRGDGDNLLVEKAI